MYRLSEFAESPYKEIRGKDFDFDVFVDKYSDDEGNLDFFSFWNGFNLTIHDMKAWIECREKYSLRENKLFEFLGVESFEYLVTYVKGDDLTLRHELAHALFETDVVYRFAVIEIIKRIPLSIRSRLEKALLKIKYSKDVIVTEINSYLCAFDKQDYKDVFKKYISDKELKPFIDKLTKTYNTYAIEMFTNKKTKKNNTRG